LIRAHDRVAVSVLAIADSGSGDKSIFAEAPIMAGVDGATA
jgi:hypothetical protein